jgi:hypothetical protein
MKSSDPASGAAPRTDHPAASATPVRHRHHHPHHHGQPAHAAAFSQHLDHSSVTQALQAAMEKEAVPQAWEPSLHFIVDHESSGRVGAHNNVDSARGLFQLTAASYHLNPHGAASFGSAVEEAQGGIRYIQQRYRTADNAANFWHRHGWY